MPRGAGNQTTCQRFHVTTHSNHSAETVRSHEPHHGHYMECCSEGALGTPRTAASAASFISLKSAVSEPALCFIPSTWFLRSDGPVQVVDLQVGDTICGPFGNAQVVKIKRHGFPFRGSREIVDLKMWEGTVSVTSDHRMVVQGPRGPESRRAKDLQGSDSLWTPLGPIPFRINKKDAAVPIFEVTFSEDQRVYMLAMPPVVTHGAKCPAQEEVEPPRMYGTDPLDGDDEQLFTSRSAPPEDCHMEGDEAAEVGSNLAAGVHDISCNVSLSADREAQESMSPNHPSLGSHNHPHECRPCWRLQRVAGCRFGDQCDFCHYPHAEQAWSVSHRSKKHRSRQA